MIRDRASKAHRTSIKAAQDTKDTHCHAIKGIRDGTHQLVPGVRKCGVECLLIRSKLSHDRLVKTFPIAEGGTEGWGGDRRREEGCTMSVRFSIGVLLGKGSHQRHTHRTLAAYRTGRTLRIKHQRHVRSQHHHVLTAATIVRTGCCWGYSTARCVHFPLPVPPRSHVLYPRITGQDFEVPIFRIMGFNIVRGRWSRSMSQCEHTCGTWAALRLRYCQIDTRAGWAARQQSPPLSVQSSTVAHTL